MKSLKSWLSHEDEGEVSLADDERPKRVLAIGDFHCGHEVGLTPPIWNLTADEGGLKAKADYRSWMWDTFVSMVEPLRPIDILFANGDLIDGRGERIGGTEDIIVDRDKQVEMAADVIKYIGANNVVVTRGTDYHVGPYENFEDSLVHMVPNLVRVGDVVNVRVNGTLFNLRHHIGGSQTPIGRATALLRESVWADLWDLRKGFPAADVLLRSHVHYHVGIIDGGRLALTLPALQGYGTRFGERRLSGIIDFGVTHFDVAADGSYSWRAQIVDFPGREIIEL